MDGVVVSPRESSRDNFRLKVAPRLCTTDFHHIRSIIDWMAAIKGVYSSKHKRLCWLNRRSFLTTMRWKHRLFSCSWSSRTLRRLSISRRERGPWKECLIRRHIDLILWMLVLLIYWVFWGRKLSENSSSLIGSWCGITPSEIT